MHPSTNRVVFHAVTDLASGTNELLPLSDLESIDPRVWAAALTKYDDSPERRRLRDTRIPLMDRAWTEVVFLSAVHPHAIWDAWRHLSGEELAPTSFWSIPVDELPDGAVIFDRSTSRVGDPIDPGEVTALDRSSFESAVVLPGASRDWLQQLAGRGARGGWFNGIPHVLAPGPVSLSGATVISWELPATAGRTV